MSTWPKREFSLDDLPESLRGCVLTVGNFDGVHLGHQRIVQAARKLGQERHAPVAALTLEPPPERILRPADAPQRLTPIEAKRRFLLEAGADCVVTARVDQAFLALSAEEFVREILVGRFAVRDMVEGEDFFFGRGRVGNVEFLRQAGPLHGFGLHLVEPVEVDLPARVGLPHAGGRGGRPHKTSTHTRPQRVSSSLIRMLVASGDVEDAAKCLGRPFTLYGRIVHGDGRGRSLGFPTANLAPADHVLPADGVYACRAELAGRSFRAAVSIGFKPTLRGLGLPGGSSPARTVEAYLLDAEGDFYERDIAVGFLHHVREQERFAGTEALRDQITKDVYRVRELLE